MQVFEERESSKKRSQKQQTTKPGVISAEVRAQWKKEIEAKKQEKLAEYEEFKQQKSIRGWFNAIGSLGSLASILAGHHLKAISTIVVTGCKGGLVVTNPLVFAAAMFFFGLGVLGIWYLMR